MKKVINTILITCFVLVSLNLKGQNNIHVQLDPKDFSIWAYNEHNAICKLISDAVRAGKLAGYNAKNLKESTQESVNKLRVESTVFLQTDPVDATVGKDTIVMVDLTDNFYLFKLSGDYVLVKPGKTSPAILKLKKSELFALLNNVQQEYFNYFTSAYAVCLDSIPVIGKRIFYRYLIKLFTYSKRPDVKLYVNDSLTSAWDADEKDHMSKDQYTAFVSTDPNDPYTGHDTVVMVDYDLTDTTREQTLVLMIALKDFKLSVNTISVGLERKLMGYMPINLPFGYLPYEAEHPFSEKEMALLEAVLYIRLVDNLNENSYNEDMYDDQFMKD